MTENYPHKLKISLKRVQTFIFEVPKLKAMLGANAMLGETMRNVLAELIGNSGQRLDWPDDILLTPATCDPLTDKTDTTFHDDPKALYSRGILARDGGHFIAVFPTEQAAIDFQEKAEQKLAEMLPGVLYEINISPIADGQEEKQEKKQQTVRPPTETQLLQLPVLQVCMETGAQPASNSIKADEQIRYIAQSVQQRMDKGAEFHAGRTQDIIGLIAERLYPSERKLKIPKDLADIAGGVGKYLALIHADGNGIGLRYTEWKKTVEKRDFVYREAHGESFYHSMRVVVRKSVVAALSKTFTDSNGIRPYEILMLGGDDLLLVCRADKALLFAHAYVQELHKYPLADNKKLDVALGVVVAQSSYPIHRLHELAESLASSAKRLYRSMNEDEKTSVIDWQIVTQSWFPDVAAVRRQSERITYAVNGNEETLLLTQRPYCVLGNNGLEGLLKSAKPLEKKQKDASADDQTARSAWRGLRAACEQGRLTGDMAFARLSSAIRETLSGSSGALWQPPDKEVPVYQTRVLDVIDIAEISRLGVKND
mgnify:CR=1 FL=1